MPFDYEAETLRSLRRIRMIKQGVYTLCYLLFSLGVTFAVMTAINR